MSEQQHVSNLLLQPTDRWKNNAAIYRTPAFKTELQFKWLQWLTLQAFLFDSKIDWWIHIKDRIKTLNIIHAKAKQAEEKKQELFLIKQLDALHDKISANPSLLPLYYHIKQHLEQSKYEQVKMKLQKSKLDRFDNNDRGSKEFFQQLTTGYKQTLISSLKNSHGQILSDKEEILLEVQHYYQALYESKPTQLDAQHFFLQFIPQSLDPHSSNLMLPISSDELFVTISQMANGKSPGPDGLTVEFYKNSWDIIGREFTNIINEIHRSGYIPREMKLGSIILIHKKGSTDLLQNYRPISLLNLDLEIYTKLLANRLKKLLPKCIHTHQYAQPNGRISNVLTLLRDIYQHVHTRRTGHFFLSLDFEKAFDSIDHQWLFAVMEKIGLPRSFIRIVQTLHSQALSEIIVNGYRTPTFTIRRGVRQGDPLSLFLFLIALEPLLATIRENRHIEGIHTR